MKGSTGLLALSLGVLAAAVSSSVPLVKPSANACDILAVKLPGDVNFFDSTMYTQENKYWSKRQSEIHPRCFVTPRRTDDVSILMGTLTSLGSPFTVKAGGHTPYPGASNVEDGVTVDLVYMNDIVVSGDNQTVSVGPGNRWMNVSQTLDPLHLAVVGGRNGDPGVSGLLLGGGISLFSGKHGWACDNVRNYELVVSSGEVVSASPAVNPDLYWALRGGGGSNFGIVTRFDLAAFPQGDVWARFQAFAGKVNTTLIPILTDLAIQGLPADPDAHAWLVFAYLPSYGGHVVLPNLFHATPPPVNTTPAVFAAFDDVSGALPDSLFIDVTNTSTLLSMADASQPPGSRELFRDTSLLVTSSKLFTDIVPLFEAFVEFLLAAASGAGPNGTDARVSPFMSYHPVPVNVLTAMQKNGGNAFGLKPSHGPFIVVQLTVAWEYALLDEVVEDSSQDFFEKIEVLASDRGLKKDFIYMNYAGENQEVLKSYGQESFDRLVSTAKTWDPIGLLQEHWKGYFQLGRPGAMEVLDSAQERQQVVVESMV